VTGAPLPGEPVIPPEDLQARIDAYYAANGIDPNDPNATDPVATSTTEYYVDNTTTTTTTTPARRIVRVPNVVGQPVGTAMANLRAAGFAVSRFADSGHSAPGTVVSQSPGGGSLASEGSTVSIGVIGG